SEYLKQQGLGRMNPVDMDNILGYFPGMQLESKLDIMFERLTTLDWRLHCQYLNTFQNDKYLPSFNKKRWGRKGIDFYTSWKPGIFAGVIMDGSDHGLKPADESNGPDFVVILEYDYAKKDPTIMERRNYFLSSTNFRELSDRLNSNSGSFEYLSKLDKSPWRVIVLRQSLKDILTGTNTMQEQIGAMRNSIIEGINLLTQDDLLGR
ncbi:MAG: hypothetical protein JJU01_09350, partial [Alkalibacterium sp.]|nr:hypothetical protein [Alkalibacterium sp.]